MFWYPWSGWMLLCPLMMAAIGLIMLLFCLRARSRGHGMFPCCRMMGRGDLAKAAGNPGGAGPAGK